MLTTLVRLAKEQVSPDTTLVSGLTTPRQPVAPSLSTMTGVVTDT
jgi:hypothetical protein